MFVIHLWYLFETKFAAFIYVSLPYRYTDIVKEKTNCFEVTFASYNSSYRSGTVNSKSFVGKVLLRIKWKFELN